MNAMTKSGIQRNRWVVGFSGLVMALLLMYGCKHEPIEGPLDGGSGGGTGGGVEEEVPCDVNTIWFQQQVMPILASSCTNPGAGLNCHHTGNEENDWIQITSYETLMASGIVQDGDFWEAINETDPDDIMPPPPFPALSSDQIATIGQWLQQGAQNNSCENAACDTLNVTYSGTIVPLINARCASCHSSSSPSGNLDLTQYSTLRDVALDGRLEGSIKRLPDPYIPMPPTLGLNDCRVRKFMIWIEDGAPQN